MQCNIDQKGRRVRFAWGVLMLVFAATVGVLGGMGIIGAWWAWGGGLAFVAMGIFAFYEARKGWCAVRAMGIKTPV